MAWGEGGGERGKGLYKISRRQKKKFAEKFLRRSNVRCGGVNLSVKH